MLISRACATFVGSGDIARLCDCMLHVASVLPWVIKCGEHALGAPVLPVPTALLVAVRLHGQIKASACQGCSSSSLIQLLMQASNDSGLQATVQFLSNASSAAANATLTQLLHALSDGSFNQVHVFCSICICMQSSLWSDLSESIVCFASSLACRGVLTTSQIWHEHNVVPSQNGAYTP